MLHPHPHHYAVSLEEDDDDLFGEKKPVLTELSLDDANSTEISLNDDDEPAAGMCTYVYDCICL